MPTITSYFSLRHDPHFNLTTFSTIPWSPTRCHHTVPYTTRSPNRRYTHPQHHTAPMPPHFDQSSPSRDLFCHSYRITCYSTLKYEEISCLEINLLVLLLLWTNYSLQRGRFCDTCFRKEINVYFWRRFIWAQQSSSTPEINIMMRERHGRITRRGCVSMLSPVWASSSSFFLFLEEEEGVGGLICIWPRLSVFSFVSSFIETRYWLARAWDAIEFDKRFVVFFSRAKVCEMMQVFGLLWSL